ncbi:MAG TPA: hypothetical protein VLG47_00570 [Candidatus Saccharimonadales bacterium]|nr:hypothetical protein [Candidatus Saccharimonadales bacterium]
MSEQSTNFQSYPLLDRWVADFNAQQNIDEPASEMVIVHHIYEREQGLPGSCLFFYGGHVFELDDPQIAIMKKQFAAWVQDTEGTPRLFRGEGRIPYLPTNADETFCISSDRGEIALLALWAKQCNILAESLECPIAVQAAEMQKPEHGAHSQDSLFYYYVARQLPQGLKSLHLGQVTPGEYVWAMECMQAYLLLTIDRLSKEFDWPDFDFTYDRFVRIHDQLYPGVALNTMDSAFFRQETMSNIYQPNSQIQHVANSVNLHRDEYASILITDDMKLGKQVFAAMGSMHFQNMHSLGSRYIH